MAKRSETWKRLRDLLQSQLLHDYEADGQTITPKLYQAAGDEAEHLLDELEGQVLHRHRSQLKRSAFWTFSSGIVQSFVGSVAFAAFLYGWWYVDFGSRQNIKDLVNGKDSTRAQSSPSPTPNPPAVP